MSIRLALRSVESLPDDLAPLIDSLPFGQGEAARLDAIANPAVRAQSLTALLALHSLCGDLSADLTILRDAHGKPRFADPTLPAFSLSHSAGLAAAVLGENTDGIGVDLEFIRPHTDKQKIAARFFTQNERDCLMADTYADDTFLLLWTRKEAAAKMNGCGLLSTLRDEHASVFFRSYSVTKDGRIGLLTIAAPHEFSMDISEFSELLKEVFP